MFANIAHSQVDDWNASKKLEQRRVYHCVASSFCKQHFITDWEERTLILDISKMESCPFSAPYVTSLTHQSEVSISPHALALVMTLQVGKSSNSLWLHIKRLKGLRLLSYSFNCTVDLLPFSLMKDGAFWGYPSHNQIWYHEMLPVSLFFQNKIKIERLMRVHIKCIACFDEHLSTLESIHAVPQHQGFVYSTSGQCWCMNKLWFLQK